MLIPLRTKAAVPTGLTLTDFENAMQVTARSKNPVPMTCSVFRVTESQMRTCGGNCCLGKKTQLQTVTGDKIYLYLEAVRVLQFRTDGIPFAAFQNCLFT